MSTTEQATTKRHAAAGEDEPRDGPVLACLDGGLTGEAAARVAGALAGRLGAPLTLATVQPAMPQLPGGFDPAPVLLRQGRKILRDGARELRVPAELRVEFGEPAERLIALAGQTDAELVVVGAPARSAVKELFLGSVYLALAGAAPCPVVVVPPRVDDLHFAAGPIVAGVDGSQESVLAAQVAARLARRLRAQLKLVYVASPIPPMGPGRINTDYAPLLLGQHDASMRMLRRVADELPADAADDLVVEQGAPVVRLADFAARERAQLLVTGSRGRGSLAATLLGSVSSRLATGAAQPVVIVPPKVREQLPESPSPPRVSA